ncbi:MAG: DUF3011 domain-containing protein [Acidobacteria bacterium]|nr:MAG: DUF3011 domain-containing protein [Acidobacteriota bacterium]
MQSGTVSLFLCTMSVISLCSVDVGAQETDVPSTSQIACASTAGERQECPGDTAGGVLLVRSTGPAACLLGRTWGYDDKGVWVSDGCSGEFLLAQPVAAGQTATPTPTPATETDKPIETWGEFDPGDGFLVGRSSLGELSISGYALLRYINQLPADETFTDHLGNERVVDTRNDIFPHRVIIFLKGWVGVRKLVYSLFLWTVNATDQDALFGNLGYQFSRKFSLYGGINGNPGTRSLQGSHPYWLGHDRVMADEFFRPYFTFGVWAQGEPVNGFWYNVMVGNNSSALGITAVQLDRTMSTGGSVWWMPTTHEFGPRGGYGDWEWHDKLATRFGVSTTVSPEERFTNAVSGDAGNTTLRLADSLNVFEPGTLAPGVTVDQVDYRILSFDAGLKYRGVFLQTEIYTRWLDGFVANGPLPVPSLLDRGFYIQAAFFPVRKKLELYGVTSQIFGDKDAGFGNSSEYLLGLNYYLADTRNHRFNVQVIDVNRSPVSSTFGYYVGGQKGTTVSAAFSVFF